jgi:hypothetical protein
MVVKENVCDSLSLFESVGSRMERWRELMALEPRQDLNLDSAT